jgi:thioredoxin reductase
MWMALSGEKESEARALVGADAKIAVIGAGAAGIAAVLGLRAAGLTSIAVFEAKSKSGGTWNYSPAEEASSSMYESLRTNLPKETMAYESRPFDPSLPSFLSHASVAEYLQSIAKREQIDDIVRFNSPVASVHPVDPDSFATAWTVQTYVSTAGNDDKTVEMSTPERFDAVVVCNGHYSVPNAWRPEGSASFPGRISHSHNYRTPDRFVGKNVVVLGAGPSGTDIALELSRRGAARVVLSHKAGGDAAGLYGGLVRQCASVVTCKADGALVLEDGTSIENVDELLLCTGYSYALPFLDAKASGVGVNLDGRVVDGLFMHCISAAHPTLSVMGLVWKVIPLPLFADQAALIAGALRGTLPFAVTARSLRELCDEEQARGEPGRPERYRHCLDDAQWEYRAQIAGWTGRRPPAASVEEMYRDCREVRKGNPAGYREREYRRVGDGPGEWNVVKA